MHATIQRFEKQEGIIFRKTVHIVRVTITFTEEENAIIEKHRLGRSYGFFYPIVYNGVTMNHGPEIRSLQKEPHGRRFENMADAVQYEQDLKDKHLPVLKTMLQQHAAPGSSSSSLEL